MSHFSEIYNLIAGLLAGALLYPLTKIFVTGGLAGSNGSGSLGSSSDFGDACARFVSAPIALTRSWFHRDSNMPQTGEDIKAFTQKVNPREEQIKAASQTLRNVLQSLSVAIQRIDQAASTSNQTLDDVRNSIGQMDIPHDLAEEHNQLMREIDRIISGNMLLKQELSRSQDILASQRRQIEKLKSAVRLDGLTQLANRAYFDEKLAAVMKLQKRYKDNFSLLMVDVDHFKGINDRYGHQAGDRILKDVAFNLRNTMRESDIIARFGGDEFAILMMKSDAKTAVEVARKICHAQQENPLRLDGVDFNVTLSIGVAEAGAEDTAETLLKRADQALYRVKSDGRNGVSCQ